MREASRQPPDSPGLSRRELLAGAAAQGVLALGLGACAAATRATPPARPAASAMPGPRSLRRPHVLFISIDDLNTWIGPLGGYRGVLPTPNFDRLAARGRLFTRAYASGPACSPSRSSLLTGLPPWTLGVDDNQANFRDRFPDIETLPQAFAAAGYHTAGWGKIFHPLFPENGSWQVYEPAPREPLPRLRPLHGLISAAEWEHGSGVLKLFDWGPLDVAPEAMADARGVAWAREILARESAVPLFLGVGFQRNHLPWYLPRPCYDAVPLAGVRLPEVLAEDLDDVGPLGRAWVETQRVLPQIDQPEVAALGAQAYLASIVWIDLQLGRLLDAWDESPYAASGLIALWSDHGFHLGEKRHWRKSTLWEESLSVPLILCGDAVSAPGTTCSRTVSLLDLFPTLAELCGLAPKTALAGTSLLPWLEDPLAAREKPALSGMLEHNFAVRSERYRYIRYADGFEELYDHERDPHEWENLATRPEARDLCREHARWLVGEG